MENMVIVQRVGNKRKIMSIKESEVEGECPDCENDNTKWDHSYCSGVDVHQVMICEDCHKKFVDVYAGEYESIEQRDVLFISKRKSNSNTDREKL